MYQNAIRNKKLNPKLLYDHKNVPQLKGFQEQHMIHIIFTNSSINSSFLHRHVSLKL